MALGGEISRHGGLLWKISEKIGNLEGSLVVPLLDCPHELRFGSADYPFDYGSAESGKNWVFSFLFIIRVVFLPS